MLWLDRYHTCVLLAFGFSCCSVYFYLFAVCNPALFSALKRAVWVRVGA